MGHLQVEYTQSLLEAILELLEEITFYFNTGSVA
jgi:hypothetical protein